MSITSATTPTEQLNRPLRQFSTFLPTTTQQLTAPYPLYREWGTHIDVISRRDISNLYLHHAVHPLALARLLSGEPTSFIIVDMSCGGGFPSVPLAILPPQYQFLLIDSIVKKLHVVQFIVDETGLTNVSMHYTRVENCDLCCDYVVSCVTMSLELLYKYTRHVLHSFVVPRTSICCPKDSDPSEGVAQTGVTVQLTAISILVDYPDYY